MDAVKFLMERNRMLTSGFATPIIGGKIECEEQAEQIVRTVEGWSEKHPRKTRQSEFLERWPDVKKDNDGVPLLSPCFMDVAHYRTPEGICNRNGIDCNSCRKKYWLQVVE